MSELIELGGQEVSGVSRVEGPIVVVEGAGAIGYDEVVEVIDTQGRLRRGRVLEVGEKMAVVEVFAGTTGLSIDDTHVRFLGGPLHIPVAEEMLGRVFDGLGNPIDGGPQPLTDRYGDVNGQPINPTARVYPRDYIQTGISAIDGLNSLLREGFLQQSAMDEIDQYSTVQKQIRMLELILHFHQRALRIVKHGASISVIHNLPVVSTLIRMKSTVPNDQLEKLDDIQKEIDDQMDQLDSEYR